MSAIDMARCANKLRVPTIGEQWGPYRVKELVGEVGVILACPAGHTVHRTYHERSQISRNKQCGECRRIQRQEMRARPVEPQRFGCCTLVRLSDRTYQRCRGNGKTSVEPYRVVVCQVCGAESERTREDLQAARRENRQWCGHCAQAHSSVVQKKKPKRCPSCQGMAWSRPTDGSPCSCGGYYAAEVIVMQAPTATSAMGEM